MSFWCHRFDQKSNENIVRISALKVFIASLGLPRSFFGFPVDFLINDITYYVPRKPKKASRSPQDSTKNFSAETLFVVILVETMTPKRHFEINWMSYYWQQSLKHIFSFSYSLFKDENQSSLSSTALNYVNSIVGSGIIGK